MYLKIQPRAFEEGAQYYYSARGNRPGWSNKVVARSQQDLITYNVTETMKDIVKPYLVVIAENAWSKPASREIFDAARSETKQWVEVAEARHFDMYDLYPFVDEASKVIRGFFAENL